jgi:hypothetical protein
MRKRELPDGDPFPLATPSPGEVAGDRRGVSILLVGAFW